MAWNLALADILQFQMTKRRLHQSGQTTRQSGLERRQCSFTWELLFRVRDLCGCQHECDTELCERDWPILTPLEKDLFGTKVPVPEAGCGERMFRYRFSATSCSLLERKKENWADGQVDRKNRNPPDKLADRSTVLRLQTWEVSWNGAARGPAS